MVNLLFIRCCWLVAEATVKIPRYQVGSSNLPFITKISRKLACDLNSISDIRGDFAPKVQ